MGIIPPSIRDVLTVGIGAALGAVTRFLITSTIPVGGLWSLLAINIAGCFLMGLIRPGLFWGTGFLGGFTSFSTYMLFAHYLLIDAPPLQAATYLLVTSASCIGAWILGDWIHSSRPEAAA